MGFFWGSQSVFEELRNMEKGILFMLYRVEYPHPAKRAFPKSMEHFPLDSVWVRNLRFSVMGILAKMDQQHPLVGSQEFEE